MSDNKTRDELAEASREADLRYAEVFATAKAHLKGTLERWLKANSRFSNIAVVRCDSERYAEIAIPRIGEDERDNWFRVEITWCKPGFGQSERKLMMSVGGYGSFGTDKPELCILHGVAGDVATHIGDIEEALKEYDYDAFDDASAASWRAHSALEDFDRKAKEAERERKEAEAWASIVPGAVFTCGKDWKGNDILFDIQRKTEKTVFYTRRGIFGTERMKAEEAVKRILRGELTAFVETK